MQESARRARTIGEGLLLALLLLASAACSSPSKHSSPAIDTPTPTSTIIAGAPWSVPVQGSVSHRNALVFDVVAGRVERVDLDRWTDADWIDDGQTLLVHAYSGKAVAAVDLQGMVLRTLTKFDATPTTRDRVDPYEGFFVVHDGRSVAVIRVEHVTPPVGTEELVDVFSGKTTSLNADEQPLFGEFAPDGSALTRSDSSSSYETLSVFAHNCGEAEPYSCNPWQPSIFSDPKSRDIVGVALWSSDGSYLSYRRRQSCSEPMGSPCRKVDIVEVYDVNTREHVLSKELPSQESVVQWGGHQLAISDAKPGSHWRYVSLDGTTKLLPDALDGSLTSFSPDGRYAIKQVAEGGSLRACAIFDAQFGEQLAAVTGVDTAGHDSEFCSHVSWTSDSTKAIASGS